MDKGLSLFLLACWSSFSMAQSQQSQAWPSRTRLGGVYAVFGGDRYKAITNNSTGFGAEVSILKGTWRFGNIVGKVRGLYISGQEDFMDGSTAVTDASYTLFATEPALGIHLNIVPYYFPGIRVYLSALGVLSYDHLRIDKNVDLTTINNSDTHIGTGYEVGAGIEWNLKREKSFFTLYGEIQYRQVSTKLAGQNDFQLTGLQMAGGIGW